MAFFNAHINRRFVFAAVLWVIVPGCGMVFGASEDASARETVVARLQAELPERKLPVLDEMLRKGLVNGPDIIMKEWLAAVAREEVTVGRAPMLPNVSAWARPGVIYEQHRESGAKDRTVASVLFNVGFYQPLYHWGALEKNYQIAQIRKAIAERNVAETRRVLAVDLRRRYFDFVLVSNDLELARLKLERVRKDREYVRQSIDDGSLAPAALDGADREVDLQLPEVARLENECAALRATLVQITGMTPAEIDRLPVEIPPLADIGDALAAISGIVSAPPSARAEEMADAARIERLNYEIAKKRLYPKIGVELSVNQDDRRDAGDTFGQKSLITSWNALLAVNWSLFDGFASQATRRASLNRLRAYETSRAQIEQQEGAERRAETARLMIAWRQLQNSERDLDRAREVLERAGQDFASGMRSRRDVDDARTSLNHATHGIHAARAQFYTTLASYLSNRGRDPVARDRGNAVAGD
ncbi:multidrug efflux system outer membrane protein [Ereboglobus sp. PH5-10]|uniref:TolC family protein n=1 Tax=Ereboglobus sp. PH5-10 TaxID=2940629 RepID=UPI0024056699|nr:TolC family protein [Ereboglobus sp. PH5-10]MDF9828148.1 multidrug efflux system outer membrane protein [Ereboglobus sp. PH5-10]